jgi:hypothetical protein
MTISIKVRQTQLQYYILWGWLHVSYGLDLIDLLTNGWPEDGLLEAETFSHPHRI